MKTKEQILQFLGDCKTEIAKNYHVKNIGLFGSFARGEATETSDIDLLVDFEDGIVKTYTLKESLRHYFSTAFGRKVDIASEKFLKPYAKAHIMKDVIYV